MAAQTLAPLRPADGRVPYFIATPPADSTAHASDPELARWALQMWQKAIGDSIEFVPAPDEHTALLRLYWAPAAGGQYGEMRPLEVDGQRGAAVYIRPDMEALGPVIAARARLDPLFRDSIVYLTCAHELGHALGLAHTGNFADIMYTFGFGGDIAEYFGRFRRQLRARVEIPLVSFLAAGDEQQLRGLYGGVPNDGAAGGSN